MLVGGYLLGGIVKLTDWSAAVAEQAHFGMSPPALWATLTIALELIGPLLILSGRLVWLGGELGVFTLLAAFTANAFWTIRWSGSLHGHNAFFEHLGLIGGFILPLSSLNRRSAVLKQASRGKVGTGFPQKAMRQQKIQTACLALSLCASGPLPRRRRGVAAPTLSITRYDEDWSDLPTRKARHH
ncbi:DoxX family protein [Sphingobium rhizovicinum]|uniref:DoxX family protein n=1 Tax=Sphingobium rhizovicinum TaxID=432308 RepID=A0ABV7NIB1_9SPHN